VALAIAHGEIAMKEHGKKKLEFSRMVKEEAEKAIELNPRSDIAYHILGRWHREVASLSPVLRTLAKLVYGGLPDASMAEAVKNLTKAASLAPGVVTHHKELGKTYLLLGEKELARKEFLLALSLPNELRTDERSKNEIRGLLADL
jgi:tetratricopeptide (TPR) repeat protein